MAGAEDLTSELDDFIARRAQSRRRNIRNALVTTAVVAIVALSAFSILTYQQMRDYHDAKYRSQAVIVGQMSAYASWIGGYVHDAVNTSLPADERAIAGTTAVDELSALDFLAYTVWQMYLGDGEKCETFQDLRNALTSFIGWFMQYQAGLVDSVDIRTRLAAAGDALGGLGPVLDAGFRSNVDFEKHPYSIIEGVDLAAIRTIASAITDEFTSPILLTP